MILLFSDIGRSHKIGHNDHIYQIGYDSIFRLSFRFEFLSNGQPPKYFDWAENEPNNGTNGPQHCVTIGYQSEKWDDDTCTLEKLFACEKPLE